MGVTIKKKSIEDVFRNLAFKPIIANDVPLLTKEDKAAFNRMLLSEYEGDSLSVVPSCDCQRTTTGIRLGKICEYCGTPVAPITERPIYSNVWIEAPDGIEKLISPTMWEHFTKLFSYKHNKVNLIEWLVCRGYVVRGNKPKELITLMQLVESTGIQRGLNFFYYNFKQIMELIMVPSICRENARNCKVLYEFFCKCYDDGEIFSRWLSIPSKVTLVTEQNVYGKFVDDVLVEAIDAVKTISGIKQHFGPPLTEEKIELRAVKAIKQLTSYNVNNFKKRYSSKPGLFRQHVFSSRLNFTGRAVITSLTTRHDYDEIHIPWAMAVSMLDIHIKGKLYRRGYSNRRAQALIQDYATRYHPVLNEILNELIDEVSYCKGIPCLFLRNPSLARGSSQCLRITKVKTDTSDNTISFSILILSAPNADFDGDEMNLTLIPDRWMYERCKALEPHNYVMNLSKPLSVSHHIALPKPLISTIAHWLRSDY